MKFQATFVFIFSCFLIISCNRNKPLFQLVSSDHSNVHFNNHIVENDSINPFDCQICIMAAESVSVILIMMAAGYLFYRKPGSIKLYLNKGDFKFEDVTDIAQVDGNKNGAAVLQWWISITMAARIFMFVLPYYLIPQKGKTLVYKPGS